MAPAPRSATAGRRARPWALGAATLVLLGLGGVGAAGGTAPATKVAGGAASCATCHQGTPAQQACARNARQGDLTPTRCVDVAMVFAGKAPVTRTLGFSHPRHQQFECFECHATTVARTVVKTCASCHERHHQPDRDCLACHDSPLATHTLAVHRTGCSASGCHAAESSAVVTPIRPVCVVCHTAQQSHKPGRECGTCHLVRWTAPARGGRP